MTITKAAFTVSCRCGAEVTIPAATATQAGDIAAGMGWRIRSVASTLCPRCAMLPRAPRAGNTRRGTRPGRRMQREARRAKAAEWWAIYQEHPDASRIAETAGVSRERVRQLLTEFYGTGLMRLAKERRRARERLRAYVESDPAAPCCICGADRYGCRPQRAPKWPLCEAHEWARSQVMTTCDLARHEAHRTLMYREPRTDQPGRNRGKRWLVPGSRFHVLCVEAHEKGWPLVALLPDQIQAQLREGPRPCSRDGCTNEALVRRRTCSDECVALIHAETVRRRNVRVALVEVPET